MAILSKGNTYSSGDAVTAANLNNLVDQATFVTGTGNATDNSTLEVHSSGYLQVKDLGITTGKLAALAVNDDKIANATIPSAKLASATITSLMPSGAVLPYAGASTPTDWLLCAGQAVSRTTYAALFTAISTTYGVGDGSTTFNLPDLRGRVPAGKDDMGGSGANRLTSGSAAALDGDTLGTGGGVEEHTLTTAQIPAHTHSVVSTADTGTNNCSGKPYMRVGDDCGTINTGSAGGGTAHTNVQPTLVLNYIIKT